MIRSSNEKRIFKIAITEPHRHTPLIKTKEIFQNSLYREPFFDGIPIRKQYSKAISQSQVEVMQVKIIFSAAFLIDSPPIKSYLWDRKNTNDCQSKGIRIVSLPYFTNTLKFVVVFCQCYKVQIFKVKKMRQKWKPLS